MQFNDKGEGKYERRAWNTSRRSYCRKKNCIIRRNRPDQLAGLRQRRGIGYGKCVALPAVGCGEALWNIYFLDAVGITLGHIRIGNLPIILSTQLCGLYHGVVMKQLNRYAGRNLCI